MISTALVIAFGVALLALLRGTLATGSFIGLFGVPAKATPVIMLVIGSGDGAIASLTSTPSAQNAVIGALSGFALAVGLVTQYLHGAHVDNGGGSSAGTPPLTGARRGITSALTAMAALAALSLLAAGCGWFTPAKQADVATIAACVLAHEMDPPAAIAATCAVTDIQNVLDILSAHKLAEHREQAADAGAE